MSDTVTVQLILFRQLPHVSYNHYCAA